MSRAISFLVLILISAFFLFSARVYATVDSAPGRLGTFNSPARVVVHYPTREQPSVWRPRVVSFAGASGAVIANFLARSIVPQLMLLPWLVQYHYTSPENRALPVVAAAAFGIVTVPIGVSRLIKDAVRLGPDTYRMVRERFDENGKSSGRICATVLRNVRDYLRVNKILHNESRPWAFP